jgi:Ca2+-binding EF-hand superfamily protein
VLKLSFVNPIHSHAHRLAELCKSLGSPLSYNVLESAILLLDKNNDGKIQYDEFLAWYKSGNTVNIMDI